MALNVGPVFKKNLNRGGLVLIILGVVGTVLGGGDASSALEIGATAASILGTLLIFFREVFN